MMRAAARVLEALAAAIEEFIPESEEAQYKVVGDDDPGDRDDTDKL